MTFAGLVAVSSLSTFLVAMAIAVDSEQPLFRALAPIKSLQALAFQLIIAGAVCLLAAWQLYSGTKLFGQQPMTWAMVLILAYAWVCMVANLRRS